MHSNYLLIYYALYKVNVEELTENCCKKKVVNCNASCYLSMKMTESSDNENGKFESWDLKVKISEFISYLSDSFVLPERKNIYTSLLLYEITDIRTDEIDHPPQF